MSDYGRTLTLLILDDEEIQFDDRLFLQSAGLAVANGIPVRFVFTATSDGSYRISRQALRILKGMHQFMELRIEEAELGRSTVEIWPGSVHFSDPVETRLPIATGITFALEAYLPILLTSKQDHRILLEGGTHTDDAPCFDHIQRSVIPLLDQMGIDLRAELLRPGFAPAGGGAVQIAAKSVIAPQPLELMHAGRQIRNKATLLWSHGPQKDAEKQKENLEQSLRWKESEIELQRNNDSLSAGYSVILESTKENVNNIFAEHSFQRSTHGRATKRAIEHFRRFAAQRVPVSRSLAEMMIVPMALSKGGKIRTEPLSQHSEQLLRLLPRFLPIQYEVQHSSRADATLTIQRQH